jgi:DNA-binding transcriptional MerR regulator
MNQPYLDNATSEEPLYNIGIVSRMTGIPVATLRVWERRYGFPKSTRTPGGHRLCSEKEVMRLRWVKARVDEGMQTGQAIRALHHLEQEGRFPDLTAPLESRTPISLEGSSLPEFHKRLTELLLANETQQADQFLGEILALYPIEDLILEVVGPAMSDVGEAWHNGEISVASEHLATNFLRQHLLMWMMTGPIPYSSVAPIVLACAPEEWHEGSLLMTGALLRRQRWPVAYLGQNVPLPDLSSLVRKMKSPAVVFVAMTEHSAKPLLEWPTYMPEAAQTGRPIICFGGRIFSESEEWRDKMPGVFLGESLREGIHTLDQMLRTTVLPK